MLHTSARRRISYGAVGALVVGTVALPALLAPAGAAVAKDVTFSCTTFGKTFDYTTDVTITGTRSGSATTLKATLENMPGVVPLKVENMAMTADLSVQVAGQAGHLKGAHTVAVLPTKAPIPMPSLSGSVSSTASTVDVTLQSLQVDAFAAGLPVAIPCTLAAPVVVPGVAVTQVAPAKVASTTSAAVKVSKKKVATVTASVKGAKGAGTGKVTIKVTKSGKTVKKMTVSLKKGKAVLKTKRLKKGTYAVKVSYSGSSVYKASSTKKTFRVR